MSDIKERKTVFSAIQPTGNLHLGNYLGAISQWIKYKASYKTIFCIADLHTLTFPKDVLPFERKKYSRDIAALYIACGIDDNSYIFIQSHIPEHSELTWILNCITPVGLLERMSQYKLNSKLFDSIGTGLLDYPVLMASDILLYNTDLVPVGEDQKQHVELTCEIARRFNNLFGKIFKIPQVVICKNRARIMSFNNPNIKMSKSIGLKKKGHIIGLLDSEKTIKKTIMSSLTDSGNEMRFKYASDGVKKLIKIAEILSDENIEQISNRFLGLGYSDLKKHVFELVFDTLKPIQKRFYEIINDQNYLNSIIERGRRKVAPIAKKVMYRVKKVIGIGY